jgi:hypothetical protein
MVISNYQVVIIILNYNTGINFNPMIRILPRYLAYSENRTLVHQYVFINPEPKGRTFVYVSREAEFEPFHYLEN